MVQKTSSSKVLALHNPLLHTIVSADASPYGLEVVLCQQQSNGDNRPVAYISRALTEICTDRERGIGRNMGL